MKRFLLATLVLWTTALQAGLPPTTLSGEAQAVKPTTFTTVTPNNQATQVSGIKSRIETGNTNLLANPSFEHSTAGSGWTCSGGGTSAVSTTVNVQDGLKSFIRTSTGAWECYQDSTLYAAGKVGQNAEVYATVYSATASADIQVCSRINGVTQAQCSTYSNLGYPQKLSALPLFGSTSTGISIKGSGAITYSIDEAYLGSRRNLVSGITTLSETKFTGVFSAGFGTVSGSNNCSYYRVADIMHGKCTIVMGTTTATLATFTLPNSLNIDSAKLLILNLSSASGQQVGDFLGQPASVQGGVLTAAGTSTTLLYFDSASVGTANLTPSAGSTSFGASTGQPLSFKFSVPILEWAGDSNGFTTKCDDPKKCTVDFSATISSLGVVNSLNIPSWVSCTNPTTGNYICTFLAGMFSQAPACSITVSESARIQPYPTAPADTVHFDYSMYDSNVGSSAPSNRPGTLRCSRQGTDADLTRVTQQIVQMRNVGIQLQTSVATTSGTSVDVTIPTGVKRITVSLNGVSLNATATLMLQLGSGSVTTTGYTGSVAYIAPSTASATLTTGLGVNNGHAAAGLNTGNVVLNLNGSTTWTSTAVTSDDQAGQVHFAAGKIALAGVIDRVRLTTVAGTATFDAGSVTVSWEF